MQTWRKYSGQVIYLCVTGILTQITWVLTHTIQLVVLKALKTGSNSSVLSHQILAKNLVKK